jgi:hypothetical protein
LNYLDNLTISPFKIPTRSNLILHLLREEIKHRSVTNTFETLGMDTTMHASNLSELVLALSGFENRSDELYDWYFKKLDHYADENINAELDLHELAFDFYIDIVECARKSGKPIQKSTVL